MNSLIFLSAVNRRSTLGMRGMNAGVSRVKFCKVQWGFGFTDNSGINRSSHKSPKHAVQVSSQERKHWLVGLIVSRKVSLAWLLIGRKPLLKS